MIYQAGTEWNFANILPGKENEEKYRWWQAYHRSGGHYLQPIYTQLQKKQDMWQNTISTPWRKRCHPTLYKDKQSQKTE